MNNKTMKRRKSGQITIFVIIAIIFIVSIALIVYANPKKIIESVNLNKDPQGYIQKCARDATIEASEKTIPNGGIAEPKEGDYINWDGDKPIWMCYTPEKETICSNQHPMISGEIKKQIYDEIKPKIEKCFKDIKNQFENYEYTENLLNLAVEISYGRINVNINKKISYTKNSVTTTLENFNTYIKSPIYDFLIISNDILNQETRCNCEDNNCNADIIAINRDYRDYETLRNVDSYNNKIYSITELSSQKKFSFAMRNCVRLPY